MLVGPRGTPETAPVQVLGSLSGCLIDGDAEQLSRERRVRRRSLIISILVQTTVLASLILIPLFGKGERIAFAIATPIPPYGHAPHRSSGPTSRRIGRSPIPAGTLRFFPPITRPISPTNPGEDAIGPLGVSAGGSEEASGPGCNWCIDIGGKNSGPQPPQPVVEASSKPRVIQKTTIDPAMLIRRIEPVYPPLARQIHKEGRVEMRARIATDGTIQSLEIVSGDPIFYQSAKEAVSQWLYRPTVLNGQPVEIDTYITVIYTMQH